MNVESQLNQKSKIQIYFLIILLGALLLRICNLYAYDLWFDELATNDFSYQSITAVATSGSAQENIVLERLKNDPHSTLYYLMVYFYSKLFGHEKALRILSVIFSMLSLIIFYRFSRLFFNERISLYALLLMAINPFHLWYAQEARAYTMACFFVLLMFYVYLRALKTGKPLYWVWFPLLSIVCIFTSYNAMLAVIMTGVAFVSPKYRRSIGRWALSIIVILVSLFFMRFLLTDQFNFVKNSFWIPVPSGRLLLHSWMFVTLGYSATIPQYQIALSVCLVTFGWGVIACFRSNKAEAIILFTFLAAPVLIMYIISKSIMPVFIHRQLLIFTPFYYLFIANGIGNFQYKEIRAIVLICLGLLMSLSTINYYRGRMVYEGNDPYLLAGVFQKKKYNDLMERMMSEVRADDFIAVFNPYAYVMTRSYMFKHFPGYNKDPLKMFGLLMHPAKITDFDGRFLGIDQIIKEVPAQDQVKLHGAALHPDGSMAISAFDFKEKKMGSLWIVLVNWQTGALGESELDLIKDELGLRYEREFVRESDGVKIERYRKIGGDI